MIIKVEEHYEKVADIVVEFVDKDCYTIYTEADAETYLNESNTIYSSGRSSDITICYPDNGSRYKINIAPAETLQHGARMKAVKNNQELSTRSIITSENPDGTHSVRLSIYRSIDKKIPYSRDLASKDHIDAGLAFINAFPEEVYSYINGDTDIGDLKSAVTEFNSFSTADKKKYAKIANKELIK